uniref:Kinesin motor domain-containing protein n=1 Tax=Aegilops tauschii subsp. strangulata TaxID=200361 RepID=A0A453ETH1_AEGTS
MISCISPGSGSCEHTLNTLRYADRVKSLSKSGNSKKEQFSGQFVSSSKESTHTSYPLSGEAEETVDQIEENRHIDASRRVEICMSSSVDPDRNSFSMIPSYPHRGREETSSTSSLNDRERIDFKSNLPGYSSKAQSLQNSVNSQEEDKVTKVSPPRRKANREDKSERQNNYVKKENGADVNRIVHKQQLKQQQQRPPSTSASQVSSRQSEKESSCDEEINAILERKRRH